ncbi:hypothetical protein GGI12_004882 [Dipsacomyces acuminosporus]|nr:hypothetical protein GGI12_004882 [Dipsacomyces acuminosporus]
MAASPSGEKRPQFDKNSASSMDYYVFAPNRRDLSAMPLDLKKKQRGGVVAADRQNAQALHKSEIKEEANGPPSASLSPTNPFVVRRKKAQQMVEQGWNSTSPFSDPIVGSGRGGIDPDDPRKHLTTPVYATQADAYGRNTGLDLLA